jgi:hypothetical protein
MFKFYFWLSASGRNACMPNPLSFDFKRDPMRQSNILVLVLFGLLFSDCGNYYADHNLPVDALLTLPDGMYAHRRGRIYHSPNLNSYRIWYDQSLTGMITDIFKIEDLQDHEASRLATVAKYSIDTVNDKLLVQKFKALSSKYGFGHLYIDRKNIVYFSARDGLAQQYVMPMNDSVKNKYKNDPDFTLTDKDWFKYVRD